MQIFYVEYDDQAEARATSSSRLDNSHWISFFYPASRHRCSIAEKSMDVSQNPQSNRVANETPWQQWRRQGCCTERHWNQRMQIFYVEDDDQAEARATNSSRLDNSHWISFFYPSGGTKFMLLDSLTKHPSRSTADHISKSISCGRCGTVNYHPLLNL